MTGLDLARICHREYKTVPRIFIWLMIQIAIIAADMQEVIGTAIAVRMLTMEM